MLLHFLLVVSEIISLLAQLLTRGLPPPAHFSCSLPHPHCLEQQETQSRTQISGTRVNTGCLASRYSTTVVTKILGLSYKRNIKKENLVLEFAILSLGPLHLPFTRRKHAHTRTHACNPFDFFHVVSGRLSCRPLKDTSAKLLPCSTLWLPPRRGVFPTP